MELKKSKGKEFRNEQWTISNAQFSRLNPLGQSNTEFDN